MKMKVLFSDFAVPCRSISPPILFAESRPSVSRSRSKVDHCVPSRSLPSPSLFCVVDLLTDSQEVTGSFFPSLFRPDGPHVFFASLLSPWRPLYLRIGSELTSSPPFFLWRSCVASCLTRRNWGLVFFTPSALFNFVPPHFHWSGDLRSFFNRCPPPLYPLPFY